MKSALLVVLLVAAAASAAVVSNEIFDVVEMPDIDEVADVDINDIPEVFVNDADDLTDMAEFIDEAENAVFTRRSLSLGNIYPGDTNVEYSWYEADGIVGISQVKNIIVRTNRPISAIRVTRVGDSQNATPSVIRGGIGESFVFIRIKSARGRGYNYKVEVYVR